jgi:hypothetical protein
MEVVFVIRWNFVLSCVFIYRMENLGRVYWLLLVEVAMLCDGMCGFGGGF